MKHFYDIVLLDRNIDGNEKSFPSFEVRSYRTIVTIKISILLPGFTTYKTFI